MKVGQDPKDKRIFPIRDIDLNKLSTLSTERVKITETDFKVGNGLLQEAHIRVSIDPFQQNNPRRYTHRTIRFSSAGGGYLSVMWADHGMAYPITFPLQGKTLKEFEALNEFSLLLQTELGLDKEYVPEHEQEPATSELVEANKKIQNLNDIIWQRDNQIRKLEEQVERIQSTLKKVAEID